MDNGLFANCSIHYPIEKYFLNCTNTTRQCDLIRDMETVSYLLLIFDYYISAILFSTAFVINVYFLTISFPLFLKLDKEIKKRYVFVVSRCISSIAASTTLLFLRCFLYVYFPPQTSSYYVYAVVLVADDIAFYSLQGSYILMAIILYIGVIHPVYFSKRLTLRKIYWLAVINWIIASVISIPSGLFQAATFTNGPINCDINVCSPIINLINFIIISIAFASTILILSFVLICLCWHIHKNKKAGSYTSSLTLHHARIRLAWTLFAITSISLAEGIPSSFLLGLKADNVLSTCTNFYQADKLLSVTLFTSFDSIIWAIVLLIDPLANIFFDQKVSCEVFKQVDQMKLVYARTISFCFSSDEK